MTLTSRRPILQEENVRDKPNQDEHRGCNTPAVSLGYLLLSEQTKDNPRDDEKDTKW